jgi:uncharacterized protein (TIGR00661 family)
MKILYALQRTGNGHIACAQELLPILKKHAQVDVLASGTQAQLNLGHDLKYSYSGISLFYTKKGALSYFKILFKNNYLNFLWRVINFPVKDYDLIINDFEPITAWACKLKKGNIVSLSHQASLYFDETPKPDIQNLIAVLTIKYYAPTYKKFGFHFKSYHENIFTPIIRSKIRDLKTTVSDKYIVYLTSFSDQYVFEKLSKISSNWVVFSRETKTPYNKENCRFMPIDESLFLNELASCKGVLCHAGFQLPSEALFLKKKLFVIPIRLQLEQEFNTKALQLMAIHTATKLDCKKLQNWIADDCISNIDFGDNAETVVAKVLNLS